MRQNVVAMAVSTMILLAFAAAPAMSAPVPGTSADGSITPQEAGRRRLADAQVREGMDEIRAAIGAAWAVRAGGLHRGQLAELAGIVEARAAQIGACCATAGAAGRDLYMLLGEVVDGADLMKRAGHADARLMGLLKVVQALNRYGVLFDPPGWPALDESIKLSAK